MTNGIERSSQGVDFRETPLLDRYRGSVDQYLQTFLSRYSSLISTKSDILGRMIEYHFGFKDAHEIPVENPKVPGKTIRPTLLLLTTDALGGDWRRAVPAAAGLEFVHNATLIHDDIIDHDLVRHNKPNIIAKYGEGQAVNSGDTALLMSMIAIDEYLNMTDLKTGTLFVAATTIGVILSGIENADILHHLQQYAGVIGRLFGRDDYLNIWGDPGKTGKDVLYTDLARRKQTFPVIHAFAFASPEDNVRLHRIYSQDKLELDANDIDQILDIFKNTKTREANENLMVGLHVRAVSEIKATKLGWSERDYLDLADFLANRNY